MRYQPTLLVFSLCVGLAGAAVSSCKRQIRGTQDDQHANADDRGADKQDTPSRDELFPSTPLGLKLREHLVVMAVPTEIPEEADRRYADSLAELRKSEAEVIELLTRAYRQAEPTRYFERWSVTKTLADLGAAGTYSILSSIAMAPLPPELNEDTHHFSTQEEEVMIRLRAIEGLVGLAVLGDKQAEADLLSLATQPRYPNRAVQTRAIKGYLRAGPDFEARSKLLKGRLPKDMHGLVTLEVTPQRVFEERMKGIAKIIEEDTTRDPPE